MNKKDEYFNMKTLRKIIEEDKELYEELAREDNLKKKHQNIYMSKNKKENK